MTLDFAHTVTQLNRLRQRSRICHVALKVLRSLLMGLAMMAIWSLLRPTDEHLMLLFGALTILLVFWLGEPYGGVPISADNLAIAMALKHPHLPVTRLRTGEATASSEQAAWHDGLLAAVDDLRRFETRRLLTQLGTLALPLALLFVTSHIMPDVWLNAIKQVQHAVASLGQGATLRIIDGAPHELKSHTIALHRGDPVEIELLATNLVDLTVDLANGSQQQPHVELRRATTDSKTGQSKEELFQSFQLAPVRNHADDNSLTRFSQSFSLNETVALYVSTLSLQKPAAIIHVRQLPIPRVTMQVMGTVTEPWPDDKALPLTIKAQAENPLAQVRLIIKSSGKTHTELVSTIMAADKKSVSAPYQLLLEPYLEEDLAEVEIIAEAIDRAHPTPLVGRSPSLVIKTASAYGRYKQTLSTLRDIKARLDDDIQNRRANVDDEMIKMGETAMQQAEESPFFDGLDRMNLSQMLREIADLKEHGDLAHKMDLGEQLNSFLFDHESLDDRERDRDFFVAARGLSRLMERTNAKNVANTLAVGERLKTFLAERHERWSKRVARLGPEFHPPSWDSKISHRPFEKGVQGSLNDVKALTDNGMTKALASLSKTVASYKEWIEELEAKEDAARAAQERKRQEGLANAQNKLRELQRRQSTISTILDKADQRAAADITEQWPRARMEQNTNAEEAAHFESELRVLSPPAAIRMKAAVEAMRATLAKGGEKNYIEAESYADAAGRLLRQAEGAAQKSRGEQRRRGRRRQVAGDNYYGQQITGGDVEIRREYQVDRRYREDVLDDVRSMQARGLDAEEEDVLEDYLRKVVR